MDEGYCRCVPSPNWGASTIHAFGGRVRVGSFARFGISRESAHPHIPDILGARLTRRDATPDIGAPRFVMHYHVMYRLQARRLLCARTVRKTGRPWWPGIQRGE